MNKKILGIFVGTLVFATMVSVAVADMLHPGDSDGDGDVDFGDLTTVLLNYGMSSGATWADGDFTFDGAVSFEDLTILLLEYGWHE